MPENAWVVVVLVIGLVVVINLGLLFMWRNRGIHDQVNILRQAGQSMRQPWKKEDSSLEELAVRVRELRPAESEEKEQTEHIDNPIQE